MRRMRWIVVLLLALPVSAQSMQQGKSLLQQGKFEEAAKVYRAVAAAQPKSPYAWYYLGYALHAAKRYDEALQTHVKYRKRELEFTLEADATGGALGEMFVSIPGDCDGDGAPDIYVSDWKNNRLPSLGQGRERAPLTGHITASGQDQHPGSRCPLLGRQPFRDQEAVPSPVDGILATCDLGIPYQQ